jgi:hypothetical protein
MPLGRALAASEGDTRRALAQLRHEPAHALVAAHELVGAALDLRREDCHGRERNGSRVASAF